MAIKIIEKESSVENRIVTAMIVDKRVLERIASVWQWEMFRSKWANIISSWCISFFKRHNEAPDKNIQAKFESWCSKNPDNPHTETIERYLSYLSSNYETSKSGMNSDYIISLAEEHFQRIQFARLGQELLDAADTGKMKDGQEALNKHRGVNLGSSGMVDIFNDLEAVKTVFQEDQRTSIIPYGGALGQFFGPHLNKSSFIGFMAANKSGKSYWMIDLAYRAATNRKKVAYFECGDLTQPSLLSRFYARAADRPKMSGPIKRPVEISYQKGDRMAKVEWQLEEYPEDMTEQEVIGSLDRLRKHRIRSNSSYIKAKCYFNNTATVPMFDMELEKLKIEENYSPEVVILDYPDIFAPINSREQDKRDIINSNWMALRALGQKHKCLVITVTQADAKSFDSLLLGRNNFSNDRRKYDHVTGMVGINLTDAERKEGVCRLNWLNLRDGVFDSRRCCHVAGCLALANPSICSVYPEEPFSPRREE